MDATHLYTIYCRQTGECQEVAVCDQHASEMPPCNGFDVQGEAITDDGISCEFCKITKTCKKEGLFRVMPGRRPKMNTRENDKTKETAMSAYRIIQTTSGVDLGIYEGNSPEAAIHAMLIDAGAAGLEPDQGLIAQEISPTYKEDKDGNLYVVYPNGLCAKV